MSEKFQLTEQWGLRKLQLGDRCEWALQYLGMDWIRMSEFFPSKNAPNIMDDDIRKFAEAVRALSLQDHGWQDISTAPKNGFAVWVSDGSFMRVAFWRKGKEYEHRGSVDGGWRDFYRSELRGHGDLTFTPIRWQPLPVLPAMVAEEQTEAKP